MSIEFQHKLWAICFIANVLFLILNFNYNRRAMRILSDARAFHDRIATMLEDSRKLHE